MFRRGAKVQGRPLLRLTTTGARTGKTRRTILGWFNDDADPNSWLVVASAAGAARHPAWAYNLSRNPESALVDLGDGPVTVDVGLLGGHERESVWRRIVAESPGYGRYEGRTDREIPIFRLTRSS